MTGVQTCALPISGQLSDNRGRSLMLKVGSTITWTGMAMFLFAGHKSIFILAMMIIGFGTAFLSTTPSAIVADVITGKSGKVIGFFQMAGDAGMIVGPVLIGFLADAYSFGEIRATHEQNLVLADVEQAQLYGLWKSAKLQGLVLPNIGYLTDIIACPGGDFCSLANAKSIPIANEIGRAHV